LNCCGSHIDDAGANLERYLDNWKEGNAEKRVKWQLPSMERYISPNTWNSVRLVVPLTNGRVG